MELTPVTDAQISALGHDSATLKLRILFKDRYGHSGLLNGALYEYANVTKRLYMDIATAPDIYQKFYETIRNQKEAYPYTRIS